MVGDQEVLQSMTDYAAEQRDELDAIESIYSEEIDILNDSPHRWRPE